MPMDSTFSDCPVLALESTSAASATKSVQTHCLQLATPQLLVTCVCEWTPSSATKMGWLQHSSERATRVVRSPQISYRRS
jgi:hypothetical protein